jgi:acyl CoA:acetate/3-ketoacid CoA transferase beta subunit
VRNLGIGIGEPLEQPHQICLIRIDVDDEHLRSWLIHRELVRVAMHSIEQGRTHAGFCQEPHNAADTAGQHDVECGRDHTPSLMPRSGLNRQDGGVPSIVSLEALAPMFSALGPDLRVIASGNFATPMPLLRAFDEAVPEYRLNLLNAQPGIPDREGVTHETSFVGPGMRNSPRLAYIPSRLSLVPVLFRTTRRPDVVLLHTTTPRKGVVSLGVEVNVLPAAIEEAKKRGGIVVAQMNPNMPFTHGDSLIHLDDIDYLVEVDEPLATHESKDPSDLARTIGDRIAARISDGSTLQMGIGAVPDAVLSSLTDRAELRIWTEMFSDGVLNLEEKGALDRYEPISASFLFGSSRLYDWVHDNSRVRMLRTEKTNDPALIARRPAMTSVNAALQVDLIGQANASRIKGRIYSGFGGSTDFIVGALHSVGGQAFIALPSWHPKANVSTIVAALQEPVTSFQHSAVVTENGIAEIFGYSQRTQAANLIENAAHPDARDGLREAAAAMGLV